MTPAARVAAAIDILDQVLDGMPAEQVLTRWARGSRFAGSKDRAAVRDHVFDALRQRNTFAHLGGGLKGRGLMIGQTRAADIPLDQIFNSQGYGADALTQAELDHLPTGPLPPTADMPEWLHPALRDSLGNDFEAVCAQMQTRAPVFLRVNLHKTTLEQAQKALQEEDILTKPNLLASTALQVTKNARRVQNSKAYAAGLVELQDAASQAVTAGLPLKSSRVLDYCAGGGGKSLAMAALGATVFAHDINTDRLKNIAPRADRADTPITLLDSDEIADHAPFDLVLIDAPCSGSGSWRRSPDAKWRLTSDALSDLHDIQSKLLEIAHPLVSSDGILIYVTCSILMSENQTKITDFTSKNLDWHVKSEQILTPLDGADGFYCARLKRVK
ncbi:RsmB/NOP family class I SAM-dependent RNA methyltransferase [Parasulfitobacter algicola]|uniref:RsmB/NOP family class I SAM-dependent RNA methyltransferase n=1 Tax=Parasulfitobacter algicola TaxID=2614809 RepID=A0ABX2IXT9_9RHOB|nr:RsmB/NOP family class I SAM-dependent RNA methyltransferase [Sulfitobacter algicola]NSX55198.1 RsmB/NOP family class I SAM-dependent RNA methyltransferase [Sulfitobacter algicola]